MDDGDYVLCSWRVRSALPLPELPRWNGPSAAAIDILIEEGAVDPARSAPDAPWLDVQADGAVCLHVPDLVRLRVEAGRRIIVDIVGRERVPGWRLFLLGAAIDCLCHQRGAFPLHAACLDVGGRTVALAGATGAGKSTLALALLRRGHAVLADDLTVLRPQGDAIDVLPSFARLKLWRDTLDAMGMGVSGLHRLRDRLDKFSLSPVGAFDPTPRRLDALFLLRAGARPEMVAVPPVAAVPLVVDQVARPRIGRMLGRQAGLLDGAARIATRVPVARLVRPFDFAHLGEAVRLVETAVAA